MAIHLEEAALRAAFSRKTEPPEAAWRAYPHLPSSTRFKFPDSEFIIN